jgi:hypothetical protein
MLRVKGRISLLSENWLSQYASDSKGVIRLTVTQRSEFLKINLKQRMGKNGQFWLAIKNCASPKWLVALRLRNTPVLWSWQTHIILLLLLDLKFAPDVNCCMMKGHKRSLLLAVSQRRQPTAGDLRRRKPLCFNSHINLLLQQATVSGCHGSNGWSLPMQTTSCLWVTGMFVRFSASRSSNIQT